MFLPPLFYDKPATQGRKIKDMDIKAEVDANEVTVRGLIERIGPVLVCNRVQHWVVLAREIALAVIAPIEVIEVMPPAPLTVQPQVSRMTDMMGEVKLPDHPGAVGNIDLTKPDIHVQPKEPKTATKAPVAAVIAENWDQEPRQEENSVAGGVDKTSKP